MKCCHVHGNKNEVAEQSTKTVWSVMFHVIKPYKKKSSY
jgi:hypothetical protein